ncbi:hypothetical protein Y032_0002g660 [Ancylostoma ceylanicum]|uniref:Uncharacterized protein n=1 Tax=Ancylostoma ceylanicum TaxID=53326 RepID=A0A016W0T8_9BILA|nr:hypothetical protein Y032_0002g660 [Ancylostoma ceylanicum]
MCITVDLIDRTVQDVFTLRCCCGGQPAQLGANLAPAPKKAGSIKSGVFVTSVIFDVHYWNQRGEEVNNLRESLCG